MVSVVALLARFSVHQGGTQNYWRCRSICNINVIRVAMIRQITDRIRKVPAIEIAAVGARCVGRVRAEVCASLAGRVDELASALPFARPYKARGVDADRSAVDVLMHLGDKIRHI